jgi:hypothetical protein
MYKFKIYARNSVGYSYTSSTLEILAAEVPAQPAKPTTSISGLDVQATWITPDNGGSVITNYIVKV